MDKDVNRRVQRPGSWAACAMAALSLLSSAFAAAEELHNNKVNESMLMPRAQDILLGPADAPVTIVTYTEHHNTSFASTWMRSWRPLRGQYGSQLRIVVRDFPMAYHAGAALAASAGHGVYERRGEAAYLQFVERLAAKPGDITSGYLAAEADLVGAGPAAVFERALVNNVWADRVAANEADVKAAAIMGSPTTFINGRYFRELNRQDKISVAIDAELTAVQALASQGLHGAQAGRERTRLNLAELEQRRATAAATEYATLRDPITLVPGASIGPFYLGQTYSEVKRLGFHMAAAAGGSNVCVATNAGFKHPYCTFTLTFANGAITQIDYQLDRTNANLLIKGTEFRFSSGLGELTSALGGCTLAQSPDGSRTAQCAGGTSVFAGVGDGCEDRVNQLPTSPPCGGVRKILRVRVTPATAASAAEARPGEAAGFTRAPVLVPGKSLGPFFIGQPYQALQQLGFRMREGERPGSRICVATNQADDLCTFYLSFKANQLSVIHYNLDVATRGLTIGGQKVPPNVAYADLEQALGCTGRDSAEGGTTSSCGPGTKVLLGTGSECNDRVSERRPTPCQLGVRTKLSVVVQ